MDDRVALLRHICDNPNDFTARLVFADWLQEQDDPELRDRAEFIRVQFQKEDLSEWDPQRIVLETVTERLLGKYQNRWLPESEIVRSLPRFRHGMIEEVRLSLSQAITDDFEELLTREPIRSIDFWSLATTELQFDLGGMQTLLIRLSTLPRWQAIEELDFGTRTIFPEGLGWKPGILSGVRAIGLPNVPIPLNELLDLLPALEKLRAPFDDAALTLLTKQQPSQSLRELDLSRSRFTASGWQKLMQSPVVAEVEKLRVDSCFTRFTNEHAAALAASKHLGKLRSLSVRDNWIDEPGSVAIIDSEKLDSLEELDLGDNHIYDQNMASLASCSGLSRLKFLGLHHNGIRDQGAKALSKSPYWENLEYLNLFDNRIGDQGLKSLCKEGAFPKLRSVNLLQNPLTAAGISYLAASELGHQIEELEIYCGSVDGTIWQNWFHNRQPKLIRLRFHAHGLTLKDFKELAKYPFPPSLISLNLSQNAIPSDAIRFLAQMPQLKQVGSLNLAGNTLNDSAVCALANSPHLENLHTLRLGSHSGASLEKATIRALLDSPYLSRLARLEIPVSSTRTWDGIRVELERRFGNLSNFPRISD